MANKLDISVVIPIYKSASFLIELSNRLMTSLSLFEYEIVFVIDNSPDDSLTKIKTLSLKHPQIRYINLTRNIGQQKATLEGLKIVFGKEIVVLDGDLQDSPELIPLLHKSMASNNNAVFVKRKGLYQSIGRMFSSVLIKKIIQLISGLHYKTGCYYMFNRSILSKVLLIATKCQYPYMSIIVAHFADHVTYITADRSKRIGSSGYSFMKRIRAAIMAIYCSVYCTFSKLIPD